MLMTLMMLMIFADVVVVDDDDVESAEDACQVIDVAVARCNFNF